MWLGDSRLLANRGRTQGQREAAGLSGPFVKVFRGTFAGNTAGFVLKPGNGFAWRFISARLLLVTNATVANRTLQMYACDEGGNYFCCMLQAPNQAASLSQGYQAGPVGVGVDHAGVSSISQDEYISPLSMPVPLVDNMSILIGVGNGQSGDTVTYAVCVEEIRTSGRHH